MKYNVTFSNMYWKIYQDENKPQILVLPVNFPCFFPYVYHLFLANQSAFNFPLSLGRWGK